MKNKNCSTTGVPAEITIEGSLGLLALGDIGLREWRKVRNELQKTKIDEEE